MEEKMEFEKAPAHNLQTWARLRLISTWSLAGICAVLLIMAATLTP